MIDARIEIKKTIEKGSKNTRQLMIIEIKVFFLAFLVFQNHSQLLNLLKYFFSFELERQVKIKLEKPLS